MCGIYGYVGSTPAFDVVLEGLKKLEYRGYDSWGISTLCGTDFQTIKHVGPINNGASSSDRLMGNTGIGHVRWATHGAVTEANAHPHFDCRGEIAIVHNGVIHNEHILRTRLQTGGHNLISETDSELFAHLIEEYRDIPFMDAIYAAIGKIDAQYSFLVISNREPDKIFAARKKSPLRIGKGKDGFHISSDVNSLAGVADSYLDLEDGDVAEITAGGYRIFGQMHEPVTRKTIALDVPLSMVQKKPPYFFSEIIEQQQVIHELVYRTIRGPKIDLGIDIDGLRPVNDVILTGAGSSFFAALVGEYYLRRVARVPHLESVLATELEHRYKNGLGDLLKNRLLIAVSQSGETRDVLDAMEFARSSGARVMAIVNRPFAEAAKKSDVALYMGAGPELSVIASKTFITEVLVLLLLSIALVPEGSRTSEITALIDCIRKLDLSVKEVLDSREQIKRIAGEARYFEKAPLAFYPLSSGMNAPVALEVGRKLEEGLYVNSVGTTMGYASELKHGPLTMVTGNTLIFIIPTGVEYERILVNMNEAKARGAKIIAVTTTGDDKVKNIADDVIYIPACHELLTPILSGIALQLLTFYLSEAIVQRGLGKPNLDHPRNLAKSVTVE
jgi:glutamine---fructose-6-phosphate transaminase (isomerizing)